MGRGFRFTKRGIEELHSVLLAHEPANIGLRKKRIIVGNSEVAPWQEIKTELKSLLSWHKSNKDSLYPPELAFGFYYKFERIHPFSDGNGRIGRLIMNKILKDHRYHPIIVWDKKREAHMSAFEGAMKGNEAKYFKFMAGQFIKTHEIYIEKIERAFNLEEQMRYFLKPSPYND